MRITPGRRQHSASPMVQIMSQFGGLSYGMAKTLITERCQSTTHQILSLKISQHLARREITFNLLNLQTVLLYVEHGECMSMIHHPPDRKRFLKQCIIPAITVLRM